MQQDGNGNYNDTSLEKGDIQDRKRNMNTKRKRKETVKAAQTKNEGVKENVTVEKVTRVM